MKLRNGSPPYSEVQREATRQLHRVLNEHAHPVKARLFVFPDALTQSIESANEEVRKSVTCERRSTIEIPLAVRTEVVIDITDPAAILAAERDLLLAFGPAHGIDDLVFVAEETIRVAGVQRSEVSVTVTWPLGLVIVVY